MTRRKRSARHRRLVIAVTLLLLSPTAVTIRAYAHDVARGVRVLGVDVGGRSSADASRALLAGLGARLHQPVAAKVGTEPAVLLPAAVGLTVDVPATIARAAAVHPFPFFHADVDPVLTVDPARLYTTLMDHLGPQGDAPVLPAVRFDGLRPVPVYPEPGRGLDRRTIAAVATSGWLRREVLEFPVVDLVPRSSRADVDTLVRDLATPAVAAPLVLSTARGDVSIPPAAIAAALRIESDQDGRLTPSVDGDALRKQAATAFAKVEIAPTDAHFEVVGGHPVIHPQTDGRRVDLSSPDLLPALRSTATPRRVPLPMVAAQASTTAAVLAGMGVAGPVSTFTTQFTAGEPRVVNIRLMAEALRGTLIRPGDTFSLNDRVGDRTHAKGYIDAPGIEDGKIRNTPGGGVSQVATTLFNAAYLAGLEDVEHHPHSYYFDRYPAVTEATVVYGSLDLRLRNDAPTAVLLDTSTTDNAITVTLYGTKRYDITTEYGPRTKTVQPRTVYLSDSDCNPTNGAEGFTQDAYRIFQQNGKELRRERFSWRYDPEPRFVCGPPPPPPGRPDPPT